MAVLHKNKQEQVKCLMLGPINATDGHSFGHKISATCQQKDHRDEEDELYTL